MNNIDKDEEYLNREFDFDKAVKNPYAKRIKRKITINVTASTIDYFKQKSEASGIPYQQLIDTCLTKIAREKQEITI